MIEQYNRIMSADSIEETGYPSSGWSGYIPYHERFAIGSMFSVMIENYDERKVIHADFEYYMHMVRENGITDHQDLYREMELGLGVHNGDRDLALARMVNITDPDDMLHTNRWMYLTGTLGMIFSPGPITPVTDEEGRIMNVFSRSATLLDDDQRMDGIDAVLSYAFLRLLPESALSRVRQEDHQRVVQRFKKAREDAAWIENRLKRQQAGLRMHDGM